MASPEQSTSIQGARSSLSRQLSDVAETQNLFSNLPHKAANEDFATLMETPSCKVERIVSYGHATPKGSWYDQDTTEYVALLSGSAKLLFEGDVEARPLKPGDWLVIPPHRRHRVESTAMNTATVWLAVHVSENAKSLDVHDHH